MADGDFNETQHSRDSHGKFTSHVGQVQAGELSDPQTEEQRGEEADGWSLHVKLAEGENARVVDRGDGTYQLSVRTGLRAANIHTVYVGQETLSQLAEALRDRTTGPG